MVSEKFEQGLSVRREVLGDEYVDRALATMDDFGRDFQEWVTESAWGTWARDGLERKQRSLNVLCLLAALNRPTEFELHLRGALRNGCTAEEDAAHDCAMYLAFVAPEATEEFQPGSGGASARCTRGPRGSCNERRARPCGPQQSKGTWPRSARRSWMRRSRRRHPRPST